MAIVLVVLWNLALLWCLASMELKFRAAEQNKVDRDEIDFFWEDPAAPGTEGLDT